MADLSALLPLNLIYLKYFCDAAKCGSISASAKLNFVSQSAISQGITKLEQGLGKSLITHQPNKFKLTYEGELIVQHAQAIFEKIADLETSLVDAHEMGKMEFACMHSFALAVLPSHLKKFISLKPHVKVTFRLGNTDIIKNLIKKNLVDFGIVLDNEDLSGFDCYPLFSGYYHLYQSNSLPSALSSPFLLSEERLETKMLKKAYQKKFGGEMPILMEVSSWEVIASLTEEGIGIGFFPDYVASRRKNLLISPLDLDPIPYKVYAVFPHQTKLTKSQQTFLEIF